MALGGKASNTESTEITEHTETMKSTPRDWYTQKLHTVWAHRFENTLLIELDTNWINI